MTTSEIFDVIRDFLTPLVSALIGGGIGFFSVKWASKNKEKADFRSKLAMVISSVELGNDGNEFIPQGILFPVGQAVHSILPVLKEKQKITLLSAWKSYREYRVTKKTHTESHDMFQKYIAYIRDPSEREETLRLLKGIAEAI